MIENTLVSTGSPSKKPVVPRVVAPCPMDDNQFWSHWAADRGYENLINGNFSEAARCYQKASQMYGIGDSWEGAKHPLVCVAYTRMSEIVGSLPERAINLRERETFEQSAQRELKRENLPLAAKLFELTALGWYLNLEDNGRFQNDPLHRENGTWQDSSLKGSYFMEYAAGLVTDAAEKRRIWGLAKDIATILLDTNDGAISKYRERNGLPPYPECVAAKATIARLDNLLIS